MTTFTLAALVILLCGAAGEAFAQDQRSRPILQIETSNHGAIILGLAVSADGTKLATASYDRTVRLWSLPGLAPIRTFRLPVGPDLEGAVYAVAFSPDGKTLVTSGFTGAWGEDRFADGHGPWCLYVIDLQKNDMRKPVCDLPRIVNHLSFSKDGKYLAAALAKGFGVRVYNASDYTLAAEDREYGAGVRAQFVEFDSTGRMATTSLDGHVRLYDVNFRLIAKQPMPEKRRPEGLSFSPDGNLIAVSYDRPTQGDPLWAPAVDVFSGSDLSFVFRPDMSGIDNGTLSRVNWSADGKNLYAAGNWQRGGQYYIRRWDEGGRGRPNDTAAASQRIVRSAAVPTGGLAYVAESPYLALLGGDDKLAAERPLAQADFSEMGDKFAVSENGQVVQFAYEQGKRVANFSFVTTTLTTGARVASRTQNIVMSAPRMAHPDLNLRNWRNSDYPTLNGRQLPLDNRETVLSLHIAEDGKSFTVGTIWRVIRFSNEGVLQWSIEVPYGVYGVLATPDDTRVLAALGDGTIRWFTTDTRKELVAFFPHLDGMRWVAWTTAGYYMASVDGDKLIGWQVNRGRDRTANFFDVGQYRRLLNRPDVVTKTLAERDEARAVREARVGFTGTGARGLEEFVKTNIEKAQPPVVRIRKPQQDSVVEGNEIVVEYSVSSPSGQIVRSVFAMIDGLPVPGARSQAIKVPPGGEIIGTLRVKLPRSDEMTLALIAEAEQATPRLDSKEQSIRIRRKAVQLSAQPPRPTLFAVVVGVGNYKADQYKLVNPNFPVRDADLFMTQLKSQAGAGLAFEKVVIYESGLKDDKATKANIDGGLKWLRENGNDANNIILFYFSGHGKFHSLLPWEYTGGDDFEEGVSKSRIIDAFRGKNAKKIIFVDACQAAGGGLNAADLINDAKAPGNGIITVVSSMGEELSGGEAFSFFTQAVVEGLQGEGLHQSYTEVKTSDLVPYLDRRVPELSEGKQQSALEGPGWVKHFRLSVLHR